MRGLFEVFIINPDADLSVGQLEIVHQGVYVSKDENSARVKAAITAKLADAEAFDFIVRRLGDVRAKKEAKA